MNILSTINISGLFVCKALPTNFGPTICSLIYNNIETNIAQLTGSQDISKSLFIHSRENQLFDLISALPDDIFSLLTKKQYRSFDKAATSTISGLLVPFLEKISLNAYIHDDDIVGQPCISFRIVRPFRSEDIGRLHYDNIFIENGLQRMTSHPRLKIWIPICNDPLHNNLLFAPYSHKNLEQHIHNKDSSGALNHAYCSSFKLEMAPNLPLEPLIFSMNLLHVGSFNTSNKARISIEFEIIIPNE